MAIEIVDFPMKNGGSFHSHVKLPEGKCDEEKKKKEPGGCSERGLCMSV